ncbi:hypothetical protein [Methylocella sp.]|uniref:hypothetical protein n=1 Tax=Methylocella sp. TaxID=1978226 RepID=UPI0035B4464A
MKEAFSPTTAPRRAATLLRLLAGAALAALLVAAPAAFSPAAAQAIVASVNGYPVTDVDIAQRMKLLKALRQNASRDAAIESMFADRLKLQEASKYGVNPRDSDIGPEITREAMALNMDPQALLQALNASGASTEHVKDHFRAELAFFALVQALNKGVEASETQVRAELAKQGGKAAAGASYTVQQVIFTLPGGASPAQVNARAKEAEALRARFTDCATGAPLARQLNDVTVRDPLTRTSAELSPPLRALLDKTPIGHLTAPQRSTSGLEMVAVCARGAAKDDTAIRQQIAQKLLAAQIEADAQRRFKELRAKAVIVKN